MNGRVSKRIRRAAGIFANPAAFDETVKRLKQEYKVLPYHRRKTTEVVGHSAMLRRLHGA